MANCALRAIVVRIAILPNGKDDHAYVEGEKFLVVVIALATKKTKMASN